MIEHKNNNHVKGGMWKSSEYHLFRNITRHAALALRFYREYFPVNEFSRIIVRFLN